MDKPEDVSQEVWDATEGMPERFYIDVVAGQLWDIRHVVARALMSERQKCAAVALDIAEKNAGYSDGPGAMRVYNALSLSPPSGPLP